MISSHERDIGTVVNAHNTLVNGTHAFIHSTNAQLAQHTQHLAQHDASVQALLGNIVAQAANLEGTSAEVARLQKLLEEETVKRETQKKESDAKFRQIEEKLQTATAKNQVLLSLLSQLVARLNSTKEGSEKSSFYDGGSSVVDMNDLPDMNDLATELEKILQDQETK